MHVSRFVSALVVFCMLTVPFPARGADRHVRAAATQAVGSEIVWDTWGVPHVYARSLEELGYGFGWAQAHSHADAILRLYGLARGRGAEYWGETYLASDRLLRTVGIPESGITGYRAQTPEFRRYIDAFAEGVNAYARAHPDRIADEVERVLPVEGADLFRHMQRVSFTFVASTGNREPIVDANGLPPEARAGSNAWAVAPRRSASGNAMLLANPHLSWVAQTHRFYEAQLVAPGVNVSGVTLIGLPVIAIGFNDRLGWSHTVNTIDVLDTYRLSVEGDGYQFDGAARPFQVERQVVKVRRSDGSLREEALVVRKSVHGPVIKSEKGAALALRYVALDRHGALQQWWDMGRAGNFAEFERALRRLELSMFNVVYADREGHIFYLFGGQVPVRSKGDFQFWQDAVPGDSSETLWSRVHPYEDLPRILDPASGFVQNSNSPPWFATLPSQLDPKRFPEYMAPRWMLMRELRGLEMLLADDRITYDELIAMRHSKRMLLADRLVDDLVAAARASSRPAAIEAAAVLESWDRQVAAKSRGAVLFAAWAREACRGTAANRCGFASPWSSEKPASMPDGLADPAAAAAALDRAAVKTLETYGRLDVAWGEVYRLGEGMEGAGSSGDPFGVFQVVNYAPTENGRFQAVSGDTYVAAVEFTESGPRARAILTYGNATQKGVARSQLEMLSRDEMRPVWHTRADVMANAAATMPIRRGR